MSEAEKQARTLADRHLLHGEAGYRNVVAEPRAAEERGRRSRDALLERVLLVLAKVEAGEEDSWTSTIAHAVAIEVRKALAPRDSGKVEP